MTHAPSDLTNSQRKILAYSLGGFAATLMLTATAVQLWAPARAVITQARLAEPVDYTQLDRKIHEAEMRGLNTYRWTDKSKSHAQVPIARALEILRRHPEGIAP